MKRITAALVIACLLFGATAIGQQITFSNKKASLTDIRKALEKQSGYTILTNSIASAELRPVSIHVKDASIKQFLDAFFANQPYKYEIYGKMVTIIAREKRQMASHLVTIKGRIANEQGEPIPGATITVNGSNRLTATNDNGEFTLNGVDTNFNIVISSINYESQEVSWQGEPEMEIRLKHRISELNIVSVVSDGYQKQTKEKSTGSYAKLDNELINRRVSTNILERLEGVTSGLIFNRNINPGTNQSEISIRGRSTIFSNPNPLIVLDNFPYTGDLNNINPNDVESITVLKDADAASIWGAFSGNGVIVITTKKGKYEQPLKLSFNSNVTVGNKPDLYYQPTLSSPDFIEFEEFLFDKGHYDNLETNSSHLLVSPAVEIMFKKRKGTITTPEADAQLNVLREQDKRKDLEKYFFRRSINQQYAVNASGGSNNNHYYFSAGFDKNLANLKRNQYDRVTLTANNTFSWLKKRLELNTGIIFTESKQQNNNPGDNDLNYPYLNLADEYGNPLPVYADIRQPFKDTAGGRKLLDWNFRPLEEFQLNDNTAKTTDYRINIDAKLKLLKGLDAAVVYQYNKGFIEQDFYRSQRTYFTRNLINQYTQIDPAGRVTYNIPLGGILDQSTSRYHAHNIRGQVNFNQSWFNRMHTKSHTLTAITGAEIRNFEAQSDRMRFYGYNKDLQSSESVNYDSTFSLFHAPNARKIPYVDQHRGTIDRFISYYINAKYIFQRRYIVSASARKDESNLFGVKTNQKGVPLWSAGVSWEMSQEKFYRSGWMPLLRLRVTNGYNGNVNRTVSAYTTAQIDVGNNFYGTPSGSIVNPPNPSLRWEKNHMVNFGLDFASKNSVVEGSIEFYLRKGTDLIGSTPVDPTTGVSTFTGNTADMKGKGLDIVLRTKNIDKKIKWFSTILFSYASDKVTNYKAKPSDIWTYCDPKYINPVEGNPLYSIYSFKWMGIDENGDPQGFLDDKVSKEYSIIVNSTDLSDLIYRGPANPIYFGSLKNTVVYKRLELSFNISWKLGYYFRKNSINYYNVANGAEQGHPDFALRWQKPGDELVTSVPAMTYPLQVDRSTFYTYSDVLIEKGDHFRLQDIQLSYELNKAHHRKLPMQSIRLYVYANNVGILWKANKQGIDPDYVSLNAIPNSRTWSIGIKTDL